MQQKQEPLKITSRENRWIKLAIRLREKKYREQENAFWLEGERAAEELLHHWDDVLLLLMTEEKWEKWKTVLPGSCVSRVALLPEKLAQQVSAAETFSGVGAIVRLKHWDREAVFRKKGTLLYLDHIADPGNVGTMIRTALALNVDGILLSPGSVDPFNPKVVRSAMGMLLSLPVFVQVSAAELEETAQNYGFHITGATLKENSEVHFLHRFASPQILVIGSEAFGISDEIDRICHDYVKIPINFRAESLNAAVACGILLAEINRQQGIK